MSDADVATEPDFLIQNHGTIFLLCPVSDAAVEWVGEHLPPDATRFGTAVVIEHRYVADIVAGIKGDGLGLVRSSKTETY